MKFINPIIAFIVIISFSCLKCDKEKPSIHNDDSTTITELSDSEIMDTVQKQTFKYFWDFGHPVSGLSRDRSNGNDDAISVGGSGFGIMVIIVGIERGYISRQEGLERITKMCNFLNSTATRYHGAWAHFINGSTGVTIPFSETDNGADLVETAYAVQGMLTAREYFYQDTPEETVLRGLITSLWESVEWSWFVKGDNEGLYWHWSPNYNFQIGMVITAFDETMITYILALASPTYPIDKEVYFNGWVSENYAVTLDPERQSDFGGPLFFTHYSFLGLSPYFTDEYVEAAGYSSYFERNKKQTLLNREWCISRGDVYNYYNENCWGLTASDDPDGYYAHGPTEADDNGTISPTAAISSIVYTPEESILLMKYLLKTYDGLRIWGDYGFTDAFNFYRDWIAESFLAIDQGPIVIMIENHRTALLWKCFMQNQEITNALGKIDASLTRTF